MMGGWAALPAERRGRGAGAATRMAAALVAIAAALLAAVGGCARGPAAGSATQRPSPQRAAPPAGGARPFTVAAAADLQFAFTEIGKRFEEQTDQKVVFTFGSTGNLAKQIENGAPIDLFAAANVEFVEELSRKGLLIPETQQLYAVGRIVLASSRNAGVDVKDLAGLLDPKVKRVAIANPDHAPYGRAAKEALIAAGVWDRVQSKLVLGENVRQTLQLVQTGNADAGIVALSVAGVPEVTYVMIDDRLHSPLKQALAVVKGSPHERRAREFAAFVNGPRGRPVMRKYGLVLPGEV